MSRPFTDAPAEEPGDVEIAALLRKGPTEALAGPKFALPSLSARGKVVAAIVVVVLAVVGVLGYALFRTRQDLNTTKRNLAVTSGQLTSTSGQLTSTRGDLARITNELDVTKAKLAEAQSQLRDTQSALDDAKAETKSANTDKGRLVVIGSTLADCTGDMAQAGSDLLADDYLGANEILTDAEVSRCNGAMDALKAFITDTTA